MDTKIEENTNNQGSNLQKSKKDFYFFRPTLLHDHADSRLVKNSQIHIHLLLYNHNLVYTFPLARAALFALSFAISDSELLPFPTLPSSVTSTSGLSKRASVADGSERICDFVYLGTGLFFSLFIIRYWYCVSNSSILGKKIKVLESSLQFCSGSL